MSQSAPPVELAALATPKPAGVFRVIHTADWHLGKLMGELDRTEEHRRFLDFLRQTIAAGEVDALIVAGDVFDSATPPQSAVRLYFEFLAALNAAEAGRGCAVIVTAGNHDSPSHLESPRDVLSVIGVKVAASLPDDLSTTLIPLSFPEEPNEVRLVVAAVPFLRERDLRTGHLGQSAPDIQRDLQDGLKNRYAEIATAAEPWRARGVPLLATGHLTALGATVSDSERDIHVGGLGAIGATAFPEAFAYVALGHLHRPQAVGGREHIRYSGSPIALSFSEASDCKEIRVLDFAAGSLVGNVAIPVPQARKLVQLRIPHAELEARLGEFRPVRREGELDPWVEVIVEDPSGTTDLYKVVQDAVAKKRFCVIRVIAERTGGAAGMELEEGIADEEAGNLLADPKAVFQRRLDQEPLSDSEKATLATAFDELCAVLEDQRRMGTENPKD